MSISTILLHCMAFFLSAFPCLQCSIKIIRGAGFYRRFNFLIIHQFIFVASAYPQNAELIATPQPASTVPFATSFCIFALLAQRQFSGRDNGFLTSHFPKESGCSLSNFSLQGKLHLTTAPAGVEAALRLLDSDSFLMARLLSIFQHLYFLLPLLHENYTLCRQGICALSHCGAQPPTGKSGRSVNLIH